MPRINAVKPYIENTYYHVYNRGVDKELIYIDDQDYHYFIRLLNFYLTPAKFEAETLFRNRSWRSIENDLSMDVKLISYCLMPNHFHLLLKQLPNDGLTKLMKRVSASYALYFNLKHQRVGHLFESSCKARAIFNDEDFIGTNAYVHRNAKDIMYDYTKYPYSNLKDIITMTKNSWTSPTELLEFFNGDPVNYRDYVLVEREAPLKLLC